ncbi:type II toxin-antitoxin system HicA family toxin [Acidithiobacillus sp. IBUN Pt1247-S3]|uniref:type II toxin-antitoxin system HicA family toxin n=1 Tax=Acidithiobacillus sp. IBUN Pt1247-S3 TaxID=3166642 RepID=UPI0034E3B4A7
MRIPRDLSGNELIKRLGLFEYTANRQTGSHIRLTSQVRGEHHVTIPKHDPLRIGTLASILDSVAAHHGITRDALLKQLLG